MKGFLALIPTRKEVKPVFSIVLAGIV